MLIIFAVLGPKVMLPTLSDLSNNGIDLAVKILLGLATVVFSFKIARGRLSKLFLLFRVREIIIHKLTCSLLCQSNIFFGPNVLELINDL